MSPAPLPPHGVDELPVNLRDVGIGIAIGACSWLIRYFCSTEKQSLGYIARRTATAGLTSLLVGMATKGYFSSEGMAFAAAGCAGYCSPELLDAGLARLRAYSAKGKGKDTL